MITYLKSKTERLEKGCIDKCDAGCRNWSERCPTCQAKIEIYKKGISACEEILNRQHIVTEGVGNSNTMGTYANCPADTPRGLEDGE